MPHGDAEYDVSVIVPVFNNAATLPELHRRVLAAFDARAASAEVVFVDDRSRDGSWSAIEALAATSPHTRGLRLAANAGQGMAVTTGFTQARGTILATIDADLDSAPEDLPELVDAARAGRGFAMGRRIGDRALSRAVASRLFNARIRRLGYPFHDVGCGSMAVTAEAGRQLATSGPRRRTILYKLTLADICGGIEERDVRSTRTSRSGYRWRDLAAIWFEVEATEGDPARWWARTSARLLAILRRWIPPQATEPVVTERTP